MVPQEADRNGNNPITEELRAFLDELEQSLDTARRLRQVVDGPLIKIQFTDVQDAVLDAQIHTLEGVLKIAKETFGDDKQ